MESILTPWAKPLIPLAKNNNNNDEIEVEDEDEIESIITDNLNVDCYDADIEVDSIEVHDIEEN